MPAAPTRPKAPHSCFGLVRPNLGKKVKNNISSPNFSHMIADFHCSDTILIVGFHSYLSLVLRGEWRQLYFRENLSGRGWDPATKGFRFLAALFKALVQVQDGTYLEESVIRGAGFLSLLSQVPPCRLEHAFHRRKVGGGGPDTRAPLVEVEEGLQHAPPHPTEPWRLPRVHSKGLGVCGGGSGFQRGPVVLSRQLWEQGQRNGLGRDLPGPPKALFDPK